MRMFMLLSRFERFYRKKHFWLPHYEKKMSLLVLPLEKMTLASTERKSIKI